MQPQIIHYHPVGPSVSTGNYFLSPPLSPEVITISTSNIIALLSLLLNSMNPMTQFIFFCICLLYSIFLYQKVHISSVLVKNDKLCSEVVIPIYTPNSNVLEFRLSHILTHFCYVVYIFYILALLLLGNISVRV